MTKQSESRNERLERALTQFAQCISVLAGHDNTRAEIMVEESRPILQEALRALRSEREQPMLHELCKALGWQGGTIHQVVEQVARMRAALQEITRGAGPFSLDPLTHADNCIEAMKGVATGALEGDWNPETP